MENGKLSQFTYGGLSVVSSISSTSTFNQICIDFCSRFKGLGVGCFKLRYALNEYPICLLHCDVDDSSCCWEIHSTYRKHIFFLPYIRLYGCFFELNGDDVDAYKFLPWYVESARSSNPGSIFKFEVVPESNRFRRFFIAYDTWIKGFMFCHPILLIDGTFIKSKYKGTLLSCCAKNGNNSELIILYFYIRYFFFNVITLFSKAAGEGLKKKMMNLLANCAYPCTPSDFDDCMAEFKDNDQGHVKNFLCDLSKENYATAHFPDIRVRLMVSRAEKRIFVLQHDNRDVFYYVDNYWKASFYRKIYQFVMHLFLDLDKPNVDTIINGKSRINSAGEISVSKKTITCSRCGCSGHNKVSHKVVV
ncbi:hypothetical protein D8674_017619 [Pyrus ussuriensis x Pyrus communis]|uniref:Uncharacterized protein n=1 Tax=Pyrus ussuriensis x Pyrus communis TaxID=2448454 RepID=A0A5N5HD84_9ROSA|nr:hypothetical protein D8674_017619 [Pyrus ussuriensis x Pyrus communis]